MNKELFRSMQEQLRPGEGAKDALMEKLASAKKKTVPVGRYVAIAACAAVIVAAVPVYKAMQNNTVDCYVKITEPHSYELMSDAGACWPEDAAVTENTVAGGGDQDQDMVPGELADNMLEAGFMQEDVDAYLASGWQMTWAKWWKFYHQAEESGDWTLEALLDFSQREGLAVNTGEAPVDILGGAYVGDAPDQGEATMAYQNLMAQFEADYGPNRYPEWYGGAYIDGHAGLIVNIVGYYEEQMEDKELYFQIWKWAGSERVGFGSSNLSLNQLKELQRKVEWVMNDLGLQFGCGIDEEAGRVVLTLPLVTDAALWALARLDPAGTGIQVIAVQTVATDTPAEEPSLAAPSVSQSVQPGGAADADEDGAIAYEPQG